MRVGLMADSHDRLPAIAEFVRQMQEAGVSMLLHAGDYFRSVGAVSDNPAFQEIVPLRFTVLDLSEHYHLPVKITPWGLSVWRGA